jgi:hypothetical protein
MTSPQVPASARISDAISSPVPESVTEYSPSLTTNIAHLSTVGVHPRTAMAAMRHSRIELTMNYYTDPALLDVAGAVEKLPDFGAGKDRAYVPVLS